MAGQASTRQSQVATPRWLRDIASRVRGEEAGLHSMRLTTHSRPKLSLAGSGIVMSRTRLSHCLASPSGHQLATHHCHTSRRPPNVTTFCLRVALRIECSVASRLRSCPEGANARDPTASLHPFLPFLSNLPIASPALSPFSLSHLPPSPRSSPVLPVPPPLPTQFAHTHSAGQHPWRRLARFEATHISLHTPKPPPPSRFRHAKAGRNPMN
ncbi:uncharacterized protein P884DRAFT_100516 [Thermothelomyces heterothallicus CBS 202.75]|uniref:uncharacterized protein n=1 Tax=Thermothelomyces heterothallicus CBS 202.75 TaxID=1149848 RepID=UPI003742E059